MNNDLLNVELCVNTGEYIAWWITNDGGTPPTARVPREGVFKDRLCLEFNGSSVQELKDILNREFPHGHLFTIFTGVKTLEEVLENSLAF